MDNKSAQLSTIDAYISNFPEEVQDILQTIRATIKEAVPEANETLSYQMPTFKLQGKNLVHFAAFKKHIGFFPTASDLESTIPEVAQYRTGKGTLQFPLDQPIPYPLIRKIVAFRIDESLAKYK